MFVSDLMPINESAHHPTFHGNVAVSQPYKDARVKNTSSAQDTATIKLWSEMDNLKVYVQENSETVVFDHTRFLQITVKSGDNLVDLTRTLYKLADQLKEAIGVLDCELYEER